MQDDHRTIDAPEEGLAAFLRRRGLTASVDLSDSGAAQAVWRRGDLGAADLADALAEFHGLPRAHRETIAGLPHLAEGLSRRFLQDAFLYPVRTEEGPLLLAADPGEREPIEAVGLALGFDLGRTPPLAVLSFEEIAQLLKDGDTGQAAPEPEPLADPARLIVQDDAETLQDLARGAPVVRAIDTLLERAVEAGATDIHIETAREDLRIRLRIDGHLRPQPSLPKTMAAAVISRVKILANLDIAERRLPQDGRTTVKVGPVEADLRVAVMPTLYGETAVLRILVKDSRILDFARIGLDGRDLKAVEAMLAEPHGILIVTGPTGSGKTTTLATAVTLLNDPARKIVTIEDPVEYQIRGVHQTQIKPAIGLTFASALRSFLRHDPDVIMVGEMRDRETAAIGIQAALTGHLVLTTLHTNSAPDAIVRLADMGVEPYLIASSLRGVLGQRLVRRLCERCRVPDPGKREAVQAICSRRGLKLPDLLDLYAPAGCPHCSGSGYRGRIGIFEAMPVDDALEGLIRREPDPQAVLRVAREAGMTTMLEDGLAKAGAGLTCLDEVMRIAG